MENCTEQIKAYIKQLTDLGYHSFQIDRILKEAIGTSNLRKLNREQTFSVLETLAEHIQFALKCRRSN